MNYYQQIENAILFIEENLSSKVLLDDIARSARLSKFHFHRIFSTFMGETAVDYIRKRRLSKASSDLLFTNKKIIDIAFEYQFESPEAFTRSFKSVFKVSPKQYRGEKTERVIFEKQNLSEDNLLHIINRINKNPEILEIEEIKIIGFSSKISIKNNTRPQVINLYRENADKIPNAIFLNLTVGLYEKPENYNIEEYSEETEQNFIYGRVVKNLEEVPDKMVTGIVPNGRYAKFTHKGSVQTIPLTYIYIFGTWLPKSGYKLSMNPDFEQFDERYFGPFNEQSEFDIYVAIN